MICNLGAVVVCQIRAVTSNGTPCVIKDEAVQLTCGTEGWQAICIVEVVNFDSVIREELLRWRRSEEENW